VEEFESGRRENVPSGSPIGMASGPQRGRHINTNINDKINRINTVKAYLEIAKNPAKGGGL
jgi:hypothetical protein